MAFQSNGILIQVGFCFENPAQRYAVDPEWPVLQVPSSQKRRGRPIRKARPKISPGVFSVLEHHPHDNLHSPRVAASTWSLNQNPWCSKMLNNSVTRTLTVHGQPLRRAHFFTASHGRGPIGVAVRQSEPRP